MNQRLLKLLATPLPFLGLWWLGGIITIVAPVLRWHVAKQDFFQHYGAYHQYEQQQRNNDYNYQYQQQMAQAFKCKWYQFECRQRQAQYLQAQNYDPNRLKFFTPGWYASLGGRFDSAEQEPEQERMVSSFDENSGAVKFVYAWSLVIFVSLLFYGTFVILTRRSVQGLVLSLGLITQYSLLMLILLPQGVIRNNDEALERSSYGWYGQMAVLMVFFNFAQVLFGPIFMILTSAMAAYQSSVEAEPANKVEDDGFSYKPAVTVTDSV